MHNLRTTSARPRPTTSSASKKLKHGSNDSEFYEEPSNAMELDGIIREEDFAELVRNGMLGNDNKQGKLDDCMIVDEMIEELLSMKGAIDGKANKIPATPFQKLYREIVRRQNHLLQLLKIHGVTRHDPERFCQNPDNCPRCRGILLQERCTDVGSGSKRIQFRTKRVEFFRVSIDTNCAATLETLPSVVSIFAQLADKIEVVAKAESRRRTGCVRGAIISLLPVKSLESSFWDLQLECIIAFEAGAGCVPLTERIDEILCSMERDRRLSLRFNCSVKRIGPNLEKMVDAQLKMDPLYRRLDDHGKHLHRGVELRMAMNRSVVATFRSHLQPGLLKTFDERCHWSDAMRQAPKLRKPLLCGGFKY